MTDGGTDITIAIVNWNTGTLLTETVDSVVSTIKRYKYEIIVADNDSSDDSMAQLEAAHPSVSIRMNKENLGFAGGSNQCIKQGSGRYSLLLNPDTVLWEGAIDDMVEYMDQHPEVGATGPRLLNTDGTNQVSTAGRFPRLGVIINESLMLEKFFPHIARFRGIYLRGDDNEVCEVDWISGACFLVRRSVTDVVGLLNEGFFMYFEDQEWCHRIKSAGHKIVFCPFAKVIHHGNQSVVGMAASDCKGNRISYREYLMNFHGPVKAWLGSKIYFTGIKGRRFLSLMRYLLLRDKRSLQRYRSLGNFLRIERTNKNDK